MVGPCLMVSILTFMKVGKNLQITFIRFTKRILPMLKLLNISHIGN